MLFFTRSLLFQFSAITDKTAAQRFLDKHRNLYEDSSHCTWKKERKKI